MGPVFRVPPAFADGVLDLLGFRPIPTTDIDATIRAAVFCLPTLDYPACTIRTFSASLVRAYADGTILTLFYVRVGFLFVMGRSFRLDWIVQNLGNQWIDLGPIALHLDWPLFRRQHQNLMASEQKLCVILESIKTGCHLLGFGPLDGLFRPVQLVNQIRLVQHREVLHWQY